MMLTTIPFYYLTIETYYLGELNLPMFSGPDDTSVAHFVAVCYTAYVGAEPLCAAEYSPFGSPKQRFAHLFVYVLASAEILSIVSGVVSNLWHARKNEYFQRVWPGTAKFIQHMSFMICLSAVFLLYSLCTPVMDNNTRSCCFAFSSHFLLATVHALIAGVSLEHFTPYRRTTLLSWGLILLNVASYLHTGAPLIDDAYLCAFMNLIGYGALAHQTVYTISDLKRILGVRMFHIKYKTQ